MSKMRQNALKEAEKHSWENASQMLLDYYVETILEHNRKKAGELEHSTQ